jgi:hypothetical protein
VHCSETHVARVGHVGKYGIGVALLRFAASSAATRDFTAKTTTVGFFRAEVHEFAMFP